MAQYNFSARRKEEKKSGIMGMKRIEEGSRGEVRKPPNYKEAHKAEKLMAKPWPESSSTRDCGVHSSPRSSPPGRN